jgi:hypothetical protein
VIELGGQAPWNKWRPLNSPISKDSRRPFRHGYTIGDTSPTGLTKKILRPLNYGRRGQTGVRSNDNLYKWYSYLVYWQIRTCFTYLLRLLVESVHVSLVAVDAEKLTMTSRRPPHKKSRQETQSTAAFSKPSFYRVIRGYSGQWRGYGGFGV